MDKDTVKQRVEQHVRQGNFLFPEDLARAVAVELGVDLEGTTFGQVPASQSPTRGDVPPFSGAPASEEFATDEGKKAMKKFDEQRANITQREVATTRPRITRETIGTHSDLEDKVTKEGPIFPKDDPSTPGTKDTASTTSSTKKGGK